MPVLHQMQVSGNCYRVRLAARQLGVELTLKDYWAVGTWLKRVPSEPGHLPLEVAR